MTLTLTLRWTHCPDVIVVVNRSESVVRRRRDFLVTFYVEGTGDVAVPSLKLVVQRLRNWSVRKCLIRQTGHRFPGFSEMVIVKPIEQLKQLREAAMFRIRSEVADSFDQL